MNTIKFSLLFLFLFIQFFCSAQTVEIVKRKRDYSMKNYISIKTNGLLVGDLPIFYERKINKHFAIQVGVGITFDNLFYDAVITNFFPHFVNNSPMDGNFSRNTSIGPGFVIEPKYYFGRKNFEGIYVGIQYRFRRYLYTSSQYDFLVYEGYYPSEDVYSVQDLGQTVKESRNVTDLLLEFGGTHFITKHFNFQYYAGVGLRDNLFYAAFMQNYTVASNQHVTSYIMSIDRTNAIRLTAALGFQIGYAF